MVIGQLFTYLVLVALISMVASALNRSRTPPRSNPRTGWPTNTGWPRAGWPGDGQPGQEPIQPERQGDRAGTVPAARRPSTPAAPAGQPDFMGTQAPDDFEGRQAPSDFEGRSATSDQAPRGPALGSRVLGDVAALKSREGAFQREVRQDISNWRARGTQDAGPAGGREEETPAEPLAGLGPMFLSRGEMVRAVIAAEVLGKPRALRPWRSAGR